MTGKGEISGPYEGEGRSCTVDPAAAAANRFVVFTLEGNRYALALSAVQTIAHTVEITPLPESPGIVLGVINVRGRVIPVIDIRRQLRLPERTPEPDDQLIIADTSGLRVALVADSVEGVMECRGGDVVAKEEIFPGIGCVEGVAKLKDGMVIIYDLDRFLSIEGKTIKDHLPEDGRASGGKHG